MFIQYIFALHHIPEFEWYLCASTWRSQWVTFVPLSPTQEHRNLPFMQELRNLFSLMVGSKRKYVDPSRAVDILKDAFKSSESQQVNKFIHKENDSVLSKHLPNVRGTAQLAGALSVRFNRGRGSRHRSSVMLLHHVERARLGEPLTWV